MKFWLSLLLAGSLSAAPRAVHAGVDYIQAIVGDGVITRQHVERVSDGQTDFYADAFRRLMTRQLVLQEYKSLAKQGRKVPETLIADHIQAEIKQQTGGDRLQFNKYLQSQGLTLEEYRAQKRDDLLYDVMLQQFVPEPIISPTKIENYYRENQTNYAVEEQVKFRWIPIAKPSDDTTGATRRRMEEILALIKGGADFAEVEKSYSQRPQRDGEWLEISKVNEAFRTELNKVKPGECTAVIELSDLVCILRLDERKAPHVAPLSELRDGIEMKLKSIERNRRTEEWFNRLGSRILIQRP